MNMTTLVYHMAFHNKHIYKNEYLHKQVVTEEIAH